MGTISVDTFFLMSGCLVAYLMFKELDKSKGNVNNKKVNVYTFGTSDPAPALFKNRIRSRNSDNTRIRMRHSVST